MGEFYEIADKYGLPSRISYGVGIGITISDVKAARAAGFSIICLSYGYNQGRDIREAEPDGAVDSLAELEGTIHR